MMRPARKYRVTMQIRGEGRCDEDREIEVPAGTRREQEAAAHREAERATEAWASDGEWSGEIWPVVVPLSYVLHDGRREIEGPRWSIEIEMGEIGGGQ